MQILPSLSQYTHFCLIRKRSTHLQVLIKINVLERCAIFTLCLHFSPSYQHVSLMKPWIHRNNSEMEWEWRKEEYRRLIAGMHLFKEKRKEGSPLGAWKGSQGDAREESLETDQCRTTTSYELRTVSMVQK